MSPEFLCCLESWTIWTIISDVVLRLFDDIQRLIVLCSSSASSAHQTQNLGIREANFLNVF